MGIFVDKSNYLNSQLATGSMDSLQEIFNNSIQPNGVRERAYLKLIWNCSSDTINIADDQSFYQTPHSNSLDGGVVRNFAAIDDTIVDLPIMQNVLDVNKQYVKTILDTDHDEITIGLHFIRYIAEQGAASYSTPPWLHVDDEPIVFVHLLQISDNAIGGDNIIADIDTQEIKQVIRLENTFDTILLTKDFYHAVTPLGSKAGTATRDIMVFTVEPHETQAWCREAV